MPEEQEKTPELSEKETLPISPFSGKIAKKDFRFQFNNKIYDIKTGDALDDIPEILFQNFKTEKII